MIGDLETMALPMLAWLLASALVGWGWSRFMREAPTPDDEHQEDMAAMHIEPPEWILGIPVVVSKVVDPGAMFTFGPPLFPGGPPLLLRLEGARLNLSTDQIEETEAE